MPGAPAPNIPTGPPVSAVRDVELTYGVPDLTKGRRPVVPPVARLANAAGTVQVRFSVDTGGSTSIQDVTGAEMFKEAARQVVQSWVFRRTSVERIYLLADLTFEGVKATAKVRPAE